MSGVAISLLIALSAAGCSSGSALPGGLDEERLDEVGMSFDEFMDLVYQEPETGLYIINGDEPVASIRELEQLYVEMVQQGGLILHRPGGVDARWDDTQKLNLTYCVSTSFGGNYATVVSAMNAAAGAWEAAANVNFIHVSGQDGSCTSSNNNVVFDVNPSSGQPYLARAFFPDYPRSSRNVIIDSSSFGSIPPWTLTGVLRHELGHTLGFRHEHTRPEAGTCFEDNNWRALTAYDSASVMHYPQCNGSQTGDLVITALDQQGAASLYGASGSTPACGHDKCSQGPALNGAACGTCVQSVCAADPYCCSTYWDSICVNEVYSICGSVTCDLGSCSHGVCGQGPALTNGCDSNGVVAAICAADPYCCSTYWDSICVAEVASIAGKNCN
ncbi:peptidase, M10A/M12A subfamilie [Chondromyces apiculatus DSM 436]|uniref:Peptidase, M10A/M12A subfamilie n=2 Tax=Chondromyces apiculatus TaxID=51 RepID=A0A017T610_9BACT|nr:peptidase, M10A/M12A subfamilie [Chondromyces apiculatus DSM 436]